MKDVRIEVPRKARFIVNTIMAAGYEAYVVGGCVRDSILGRTPQDWDITTSATPQQVKALFPRTLDTGLQHGTVTVMQDKEGFEVTTYRIDGEYEDSRHPREVIFTPNLEEDLKRRDFTINAMAYNEEIGLVDLFGGMRDLQEGIIRCVGNAEERFAEDALRMLRAIRFSAQLGYSIEEKTRAAIRLMAPTLSRISAERIQVELVKMMVSDHPDYLREAYALGVTKVFLPEFDACMETGQHNPHHRYSVGEHILHSCLEVGPDKVLRLTMLLHDIAKPGTLTVDKKGISHFYGHAEVGRKMAEKILRRLKFDNHTTQTVCTLVKYHDHDTGVKEEPTLQSARRFMNKIGAEYCPALFAVKRADMLAQSDYRRQEKLERLHRWEELYEQICRENQCVSLKQLAVTGKDLIGAGMKPGKELGEVLQFLLRQVLDDPSLNERETLLRMAKDFCSRHHIL